MCVCLYVCVCPSQLSDSSETIEVIIIKLGTMTASDMGMHHVFFILTLTFIQGHTDLNHENNKLSIVSQTFQAVFVIFGVNIVRLRVYIIVASSMTLTFTEGYNCVSNLPIFLTCSLIEIY